MFLLALYFITSKHLCVRTYYKWIQANQPLAKAIAHPIAGLTSLIAVLGSLFLILASTLKLSAFSVAILSKIGAVIIVLAVAFNLFRGAILSKRLAILSLIAFNPVALVIILVVGALAGTAWPLWRNWDKVIKPLASA